MTSQTKLADGRWHTLTIAEQLGNIGSEVGRTINSQKTNDDDRWQGSFRRALELFDLTASDPRWSASRKKEILRSREVFCDAVLNHRSDDELQNYFMYFALLARSGT